MYIESNSRVTLTEVKNTQKTLTYAKKKWRTVIQPGDFNELENRKCSTKWLF